MSTKWIISIIFLLSIPGAFLSLEAQSLVGMTKDEVRAIMDKKVEFRVDKTIVRQQFNYLKYVNNLHTKTLIVYFSQEDICTKTRLVCDYAEYNEVTDDLDDQYERIGDGLWEYQHGRRTYSVTLEKDEWYFVVTETKKEK